MSELEPRSVQPPAPVAGPTSVPVTEAQRQAMIFRLQQALARDLISFADVDRRFELVFTARNLAELDEAAAGLPPEPAPPPPPSRAARHLAPASNVTLIGDLKMGGWIAVGPRISALSLIGDALIDLSSADIPPEGVEVVFRAAIGDLQVIVPDGARVQVQAFSLIGDRKELLVAPVEEGPTVRVKMYAAIGDVKVYSLSQVPDKKLRRLWKALRVTKT